MDWFWWVFVPLFIVVGTVHCLWPILQSKQAEAESWKQAATTFWRIIRGFWLIVWGLLQIFVGIGEIIMWLSPTPKAKPPTGVNP
jgi:CBS domain containing-hemolysin-like protein